MEGTTSSPALERLTQLVKSGAFADQNIFQRRPAPTLTPALQAAPAPAEDPAAGMSVADLEREAKVIDIQNKIAQSRASKGISALNPVQSKMLETYSMHYGEPPADANGVPDMKEVSRGIRDLADEAEGLKLNFGQKVLLEALPPERRGRAFGADGKVINTADLAKLVNESGELGKPLTEAQKAEEQSKIQKVREIRTQMDAAKSRVNSTGVNKGISAVGPIRGSAVGRLTAMVQAVGGDDKVLNNQRLLEQFVNQQILQGASQMKGNLSDRDVKFLEKSVPRLSDPVATWNAYLDELTGFLKNREDSALSVLAGQPVAPAPGTPAAPAAKPAAAPAAGAELPLVETMQDMQKYKGQRVRFADGSIGKL